MLKEKPLISLKQAEKLIYTMAKYSDHTHSKLRNLKDIDIQKFFDLNGKPWKSLVGNTRSPANLIPLIENILGYEYRLEASNNTSLTIYQQGHKTTSLIEAGNVSIFDYHTKFIKALEERKISVQKGSYTELLSCVTHGVAAIESYITIKATIWNKSRRQPTFETEGISNLDIKLNDWLFRMTGFEMNKSGAIWNDFMEFKNINNKIIKHNSTGSHAASYNEMVRLINRFRIGIAEFLFNLHQKFDDLVPSKIIRGIYLPDVFYVKEQ